MNKQDNIAVFTQVSGIQYNCVLTMKEKEIKTIQGLEVDCIIECDTTYGVGRWVRVDKIEERK